MSKFKNALNRLSSAKKTVGAVVLGASTGIANAAITVDPLTGVPSGTMDMTPFFGGVTIALTATGIVTAVFLAYRAIKKV